MLIPAELCIELLMAQCFYNVSLILQTNEFPFQISFFPLFTISVNVTVHLVIRNLTNILDSSCPYFLHSFSLGGLVTPSLKYALNFYDAIEGMFVLAPSTQFMC